MIATEYPSTLDNKSSFLNMTVIGYSVKIVDEERIVESDWEWKFSAFTSFMDGNLTLQNWSQGQTYWGAGGLEPPAHYSTWGGHCPPLFNQRYK